ncbi:MAG: hypothetical protein K2H82_08215 [Oscillospiraceae bacterium]|nr:hypothetical protein [Oscillospiraceae bacterium]
MNCVYCVKRIRRIFAVISLNAVLFSTGCTAVQTMPGKIANPMTGAFTAEVTITNADTESKAQLTRYGMDAWCVVFSEPQTLSGVQLDFLDDEVKASYKGLEFSVPQSAQAIRTELEDLMQIIDDMALTPDLNGKTDEGKLICEGSIEEGSYTLTFTDAGIPTEFSLPCYSLVVVFDSFTQQGSAETIPGTQTTPESATIPATEIPAQTESGAEPGSESMTEQSAAIPEDVPAEQAAIPEDVPAEPVAIPEELPEPGI